jgi:hypothetical protein
MTVADPDQGITLNVGGDPANLPSQQNAEFGGLLVRLNRLYLSEADRTARMLTLSEGNLSHLAAEDREEIFNGVAHVSLAHRSPYSYLRRTANAAPVNNSTALVSDATLTSPLAASSTFTYSGLIKYSASTVADIKVLVELPVGASGETCLKGPSVGNTVAAGDTTYMVTTGSTTPFGGIGVGTVVFCEFWGRVTTVAAGNLVVRYAQQNLEVSDVTVRADSWMEVIKRS